MKREAELRRVVETDLKLHPRAMTQDLCKAVFQALYGPGHMAPSAQAAQRMLLVELDEEMNSNEPVWQPLGDIYGRLNLACWKSEKLPPETLVDAFLRSAAQPAPDWRAEWPALCGKLVAWLEENSYTRSDDETRSAVLQTASAPSLVRHSEAYRKLYLPHYRVLTQEQWDILHTKYTVGGNT